MTAVVFNLVTFPICIDDYHTSTVNSNRKACMDNPVQHPTHDTNVVYVCTDTGQVVGTVPVIPVDGIEVLSVLIVSRFPALFTNFLPAYCTS